MGWGNQEANPGARFHGLSFYSWCLGCGKSGSGWQGAIQQILSAGEIWQETRG